MRVYDAIFLFEHVAQPNNVIKAVDSLQRANLVIRGYNGQRLGFLKGLIIIWKTLYREVYTVNLRVELLLRLC
jgi:hypothetical protein